MATVEEANQERSAEEAKYRLDRETRERFESWRMVFCAALVGTASTGDLIVKLVDHAAQIADAAVPQIMKRDPRG